MDKELLLKTKVIPIDGPVASGKDTVAAIAADKLGWKTLDSGAIYRTVTRICILAGVDVNQTERVIDCAKRELGRIGVRDGVLELDSSPVIRDMIKTPEIDKAVSIVSAIPEVRRLLVRHQREFATPKGLIACGRDMGSVIFTEAKLKVFLTASPEARAERRFREYQSLGKPVTFDEVLSDLIERDRHDTTRDDSPLVLARGAQVINSSHKSPQYVADWIVDLYVDMLSSQ